MKTKKQIIGFDGDCGLCHGFVLFVLKRDQRAVFTFSPLASEYFKSQISSYKKPIPDSVLLLESKNVWIKSTAVVKVLKQLGFGWKVVAGMLWIIPRPIRNLGYDGIAKIRKVCWEKPAGACPVVPKQWQGRFSV